MHACMYVCIYVYMYICIHLHSHTYMRVYVDIDVSIKVNPGNCSGSYCHLDHAPRVAERRFHKRPRDKITASLQTDSLEVASRSGTLAL